MHLRGGRGNEDEDREEGIGRRTGEEKYGRAKRIQNQNKKEKGKKKKGGGEVPNGVELVRAGGRGMIGGTSVGEKQKRAPLEVDW